MQDISSNQQNDNARESTSSRLVTNDMRGSDSELASRLALPLLPKKTTDNA